jgi:hypothetical protein
MTKWNLFGNGLAAACIAALMVGCDEQADIQDDHVEVDEEVSFRQIADNGTEVNGTEINGRRFNGRRFNGQEMNNAALVRLQKAATLLQNFALQGSLIKAKDAGTLQQLIGGQLLDTEIEFTVTDAGNTVQDILKIDAITQSAGLYPDIYFNRVLRKVGSNAWESLCFDGSSNPTEAIAMKNDWDPDSAARISDPDAITWACRGAALAKCAEFGYRPWAQYAGTSLEDYHQACVRMVRADYCGNGTTYTTNGNPIDVADDLGIQTHDTAWGVEAKWGPDGAVCLNTPRKLQHPRASIPCAAQLPTCSNSAVTEHGGILMTRVVPNSNP